MSTWIDEETDKLKVAMRATDLHINLLGVTLIIDGNALHVPNEAIDAMANLIRDAERQVIREERRRQQQERGAR
jgi:hypothetical protein